MRFLPQSAGSGGVEHNDMSRLVKRQVLCLQLLNRTHNTKLRKALLEYTDAELISALCECAHNILRGTVRLTPREKVRLRSYTSDLRTTANRKTVVTRRHRILQQRVVSYQLVSSFHVDCIYAFTASTSRIDGAREEDGVG